MAIERVNQAAFYCKDPTPPPHLEDSVLSGIGLPTSNRSQSHVCPCHSYHLSFSCYTIIFFSARNIFLLHHSIQAALDLQGPSFPQHNHQPHILGHYISQEGQLMPPPTCYLHKVRGHELCLLISQKHLLSAELITES